jgi:hypothetical protein
LLAILPSYQTENVLWLGGQQASFVQSLQLSFEQGMHGVGWLAKGRHAQQRPLIMREATGQLYQGLLL